MTGYSAGSSLGTKLGDSSPLTIFYLGSCTNKSPAIVSYADISSLSSCQLTFARFYLPILVPSAKKAIYMDDDVIVQGTKE